MGEVTERKPPWLKFKIPGGKSYTALNKIISTRNLHTVCTEARCPNMGECFGCGTATFLIMGNVCTRNCRYCSIRSGNPGPVDPGEPARLADAVKRMDLKHAVITSVTRDDLDDGGALYFCMVIEEIRAAVPQCSIELLVPDFGDGMESSIDMIMKNSPDVLNHNIEVASKLFKELRPMGNYKKSLQLLKHASSFDVPLKSGLMIGFGEDMSDIDETLNDLRGAGCKIVTVGQYLQSHRGGHAVKKYYEIDEFELIKQNALKMGFDKVLAGPLVRSSYRAAMQW